MNNVMRGEGNNSVMSVTVWWGRWRKRGWRGQHVIGELFTVVQKFMTSMFHVQVVWTMRMITTVRKFVQKIFLFKS